MVKGRTTETVRELLAADGYRFIGEYVNTHVPLRYECPNGHRGKTGYNNWVKGRRCQKCASLKKTHIHDPEYVEEYFRKYGCELLDEYETSRQILRFQCVCGNVGTTSFNRYLKKPETAKLCQKCNIRKLSESELEEIFAQQGCVYIGKDTTTYDYFFCTCECGNNFRTTLNRLRKGYKCQACKQYRKPSGFHKPKRLIQDAEAV